MWDRKLISSGLIVLGSAVLVWVAFLAIARRVPEDIPVVDGEGKVAEAAGTTANQQSSELTAEYASDAEYALMKVLRKEDNPRARKVTVGTPLSRYTLSELDAQPWRHDVVYAVMIESDDPDVIQRILLRLIQDNINQDPSIDVMVVYVYRRRIDFEAKDGLPYARAEWWPRSGPPDAYVVTERDRSSYVTRLALPSGKPLPEERLLKVYDELNSQWENPTRPEPPDPPAKASDEHKRRWILAVDRWEGEQVAVVARRLGMSPEEVLSIAAQVERALIQDQIKRTVLGPLPTSD